MNALNLTAAHAQTMSSQEIADLTGKRHDNVMRDVRTMLVELHGEGGLLSFEDTHTNPQNGQTYPIFTLPKRETLILVSGYNVQMRAKIIDRWQELEEQAKNPILALSRVDLLKLALESEEKRAALEAITSEQAAKIEADAPKVAALDRIALADGAMCISNAAKILQIPPRQLFRYLSEKRWIFRRPGGSGWVGYSDALKAGVLEHKITTVERADGSEKMTEQVLVTAKGLTVLGKRLAEQQQRLAA